MSDLSIFSDHPYRFIRKILGGYFWSHVTIALAVVGAVTCSVSTQYGVKYLVDALSDPARHASVWTAFAILITLIAADNMFWRLAAWVGHSTFVNVSGSVRRKLFRHLTGHAPSFFSTQSAGALTSRITSTANALYTAENDGDVQCDAAADRYLRLHPLSCDRQHPDGAELDGRSGVRRFRHVSLGCRRYAAPLRLRQQRGERRRRHDRRRFQYVFGEGFRASQKRAFAARRRHQQGNASPQAEPVFSRASSNFSRGDDSDIDDRRSLLGRFPFGRRDMRRRATSCWFAHSVYRSFLPRATWPSPWSTSRNIGRVFPKRSARSWCRMNSLSIPERAGLPPRVAPSNSAT